MSSLLLCACAGEGLVVGEERARAAAGGDGPGPSEVVGGAGQDGVALLEQCPARAVQRKELLGCWPTRHVGQWRGFFIGVPRHETPGGMGAEFPAAELALLIGNDGTGELTFGVAEAPEEAAPCGDLEAHRGCSSPGRLMPGFQYRLDEIELFDPEDDLRTRIPGEPPLRRGERMEFRVALGQPWEMWCTDQPAPEAGCDDACAKQKHPGAASTDVEAALEPSPPAGCHCDPEGCRPDAPALRFELRMSGDGKALRGAYLPNDPDFGTATLELRKDP